jgi:hypothetical protein
MFTTNESFKSPVQFDRRSTDWRAVELTIGHPFLMVRLSDEGMHRYVLLHGMDDLLALHQQSNVGGLTAIGLLEPPGWSSTGAFESTKMVEVLYQSSPPDGSSPSALIRDAQGALYGGHPIKKLASSPGPISSLLQL